jgi:hypothetical protein
MRLKTKKQKEDYRNSFIDSLRKYDNFKISYVYDIIIVTYDKAFGKVIRPCMQVWKQGAAMSFANFYYTKPELREKAIEKYTGMAEDRVSRKIKNTNARKNFKHSLKVGDILHSSWGWEQTNCDFYQVIEVIKSFVVIQRIGSKSVRGSEAYMSDSRLAVKDSFLDEKPIRKKVLLNNCVKINHSSTAYPWDGTPCYCSWYA